MSDAHAALLVAPPLHEANEDEGEEETPEEMHRKMEDAIALNAQLKEIMRQHEEEQRMQQQRLKQRNRQQTMGRSPPSRASKGGWGGVTHTGMRSNEINRENAILVSKLSTIATRGSGYGATAPFRPPPQRSTIAINQRRKDDQVARENAAMARRLNSVKATSTLSNKTAAKHSKDQQRYLQVLRPPSYSSALAAPQQVYATQQQPLHGRSASRSRSTAVTPQLLPRVPFQM